MHTRARGTYARRGKPCRRGAAFAAASGINARTAGVPGIRDRALPADVARQAEPLMCTHMSGGRSQGQALPSWRSLRTRYEMHGEQVLTCTHLSVEHTLAGASPAVVVRSSDALRDSRCVGADVHTYARRGPGHLSRPEALPSWRGLWIRYETQGV